MIILTTFLNLISMRRRDNKLELAINITLKECAKPFVK